ncbi:hypothetical protein C4564_05720 [Candidatus Microgenomates bacterium]|nr:MAG: hypothetical protein C4564_05720 [Candidatus Microgenomates bacterium]
MSEKSISERVPKLARFYKMYIRGMMLNTLSFLILTYAITFTWNFTMPEVFATFGVRADMFGEIAWTTTIKISVLYYLINGFAGWIRGGGYRYYDEDEAVEY